MVCVGVITCACWRRRKISNNTNQQQATVIGVASNNANQRQGNVIGVTSSPHAVQQIQMVPQQGVQKVTIVQPNGQPRQLMQMQNGAQPTQLVQGGVSQPTQGQGYVIQQPGRNNFNNQPSTMTYQSSVTPLAPPPVVVQATRIHTNAVNRQNI